MQFNVTCLTNMNVDAAGELQEAGDLYIYNK